MGLIYLISALKCDSFDAAIGIKIPFFRVLVTIEPGHTLLQFVTTNCLIEAEWKHLKEILIKFFSSYYEVKTIFSIVNRIIQLNSQ